MAEQVKRRVNAARIAVAFAAAGVIAGGAATASGARDDVLAPNSVGTQQVRNDTLLHKDFKQGEVYSKDDVAKKFLKIDAAAEAYVKGEDLNGYLKQSLADSTFLKIEDAANTYVKGESLNGYLKIDEADQKYLKIDDAAVKYLKIDDAAVKYLAQADAALKYLEIDDANQKFLKIDATAVNSAKLGGLSASDFVRGNGSAVTGATTVPQGQQRQVISVERLFAIVIDNESGSPKLEIVRAPETSGVPFSWGMENGVGGTVGENQGFTPVSFQASSDTQVLQILIGGMVGTLSITVTPSADGVQAFGQLLLSDSG